MENIHQLRAKINQISSPYQAQVWDNGRFEVHQVKEDDKDRLVNNLRRISKEVHATANGKYDFSRPAMFGNLHSQYYNIYGEIDVGFNEKLIQSSSDKALQQNIKTEIDSGKSPKQAAAIAYSIQRKNESMGLEESTSINIQELVAEIIARMEDHLEYSNNVTTDIEFELPTTSKKEIRKVFALLNDMSSDKYIDYEVEDEQTYPGATYYYASLSRKYPDDYYFDYEDPETEDAQPGQRTGKYKISDKSLKESHNDQELKENMEDKTYKVTLKYRDDAKEHVEKRTAKNLSSLEYQLDHDKSIVQYDIEDEMVESYSNNGQSKAEQLLDKQFKDDTPSKYDLLKSNDNVYLYKVIFEDGDDVYAIVLVDKSQVIVKDFEKDILALWDKASNLDESLNKTYQITVKYHNEPNAKIEARSAKDRKDLEYQLNMDDEVEWYDFDEKQFNESYSKEGYSWDEVNGMIHIYEDGKLIDTYPDIESAKEAGWDLNVLTEGLGLMKCDNCGSVYNSIPFGAYGMVKCFVCGGRTFNFLKDDKGMVGSSYNFKDSKERDIPADKVAESLNSRWKKMFGEPYKDSMSKATPQQLDDLKKRLLDTEKDKDEKQTPKEIAHESYSMQESTLTEDSDALADQKKKFAEYQEKLNEVNKKIEELLDKKRKYDSAKPEEKKQMDMIGVMDSVSSQLADYEQKQKHYMKEMELLDKQIKNNGENENPQVEDPKETGYGLAIFQNGKYVQGKVYKNSDEVNAVVNKVYKTKTGSGSLILVGIRPDKTLGTTIELKLGSHPSFNEIKQIQIPNDIKSQMNQVAKDLGFGGLKESLDQTREKALKMKENSNAFAILYGYRTKDGKEVELEPEEFATEEEYKERIKQITDSLTKLSDKDSRGNRYGHERDIEFYTLYKGASITEEVEITESVLAGAILTGLGTAIGSGLIQAVQKLFSRDPGKKKSRWYDYRGYVIERTPEAEFHIYDSKSKEISKNISIHTLTQAKKYVQDVIKGKISLDEPFEEFEKEGTDKLDEFLGGIFNKKKKDSFQALIILKDGSHKVIDGQDKASLASICKRYVELGHAVDACVIDQNKDISVWNSNEGWKENPGDKPFGAVTPTNNKKETGTPTLDLTGANGTRTVEVCATAIYNALGKKYSVEVVDGFKIHVIGLNKDMSGDLSRDSWIAQNRLVVDSEKMSDGSYSYKLKQRQGVKLREEWNIGSDKSNLTAEEFNLLETLAQKLEMNSPNQYKYVVQYTYEDFGAGMQWYTIVCYDKKGDSWQVLDTKEWLQLMNTGDIDAVYSNVINGEYFQDKIIKESLAEMNHRQLMTYMDTLD